LNQLHSGREVVHRPVLKTRGMRTIITHRKGWSESISSMAYNSIEDVRKQVDLLRSKV
jgi:hypothetical protein